MLKKEFTQYPHHTDPYAKHRLIHVSGLFKNQSKIISTMLRLILEMIRMQ